MLIQRTKIFDALLFYLSIHLLKGLHLFLDTFELLLDRLVSFAQLGRVFFFGPAKTFLGVFQQLISVLLELLSRKSLQVVLE